MRDTKPTVGARAAPEPSPRAGLTLDEIHEAAAAILDELGPDLFTMEDLAERVHRSRRSIYRRCGCKRKVVLGVVRLFFRRIAEGMSSADRNADAEHLAAHLARAVAGGAAAAGALVRVALWAKDMPGVAEDVAGDRERCFRLLRDRLRATDLAGPGAERILLEMIRERAQGGEFAT